MERDWRLARGRLATQVERGDSYREVRTVPPAHPAPVTTTHPIGFYERSNVMTFGQPARATEGRKMPARSSIADLPDTLSDVSSTKLATSHFKGT
jgi:hypothetical protein